MPAWFDSLVNRHVAFLVRRAGTILLVSLLLTVVAFWSASKFELKTDFAELLPQDEPSIKDLDRAKSRVGGLSNMIVGVTGDDVAANRKLVDDLAVRYQRLPKEYLYYLKYNIQEEKEFYQENKHLFVDLDDLKEIYKRLNKKITYERIKNNPLLSMDFDGEPNEPVTLDLSDIKKKYENKTSSYSRYLDGYLTGEDGKLFAILLYPPGASTGVEFDRRMIREVKRATADVCAGRSVADNENFDDLISTACPKRYPPSSTVSFTGGIVTALLEQQAIIDDIVFVTTLCVLLNMLAIFLYFRSWRSILVTGSAIIAGTTATFGISIFIVDHLNTSTAFLASIIVGNGINFGIIQLARYFEERRAGRSLFDALAIAIKYTTQSTGVAALAASIAYGSLIITRFRGFVGFGYMGGLGMILCWISAFTVQPAMLVLLERLRPMKVKQGGQVIPNALFMRPYSHFVTRIGLPICILGVFFAAVCAVFTVRYLKDPFEYDFRNLRNQAARLKGPGKLTSRVDKIFPKRLEPSFILADRIDQVPLIYSELIRNNSNGTYKGLFQEINTIFSYLPDSQEQKIKILNKIRRLLSDSTLTWLSDQERKDIEQYRPPSEIKPVNVEDLPSSLTRMFTELDGRTGLIVLLYPRQDRSVWDGHFLIEISDASRVVQLPDGERIYSAGVGTIFADMIRAIERDGLRAVLLAFLGVVLMVILVYRSLRFVLLLLLGLCLSVTWMLGSAAFINEKLNFLNFIALPITFGIGIDYAVNTLGRYRMEGQGSIQKVLEQTGGAVFLCALTTIIGYSSLLIADNRALVSFGLLANFGEITSLSAALLFLPAIVHVITSRQLRISKRKKMDQEDKKCSG